MRARWPVIFGAFVLACVATQAVPAAQQPDRVVETETIVVPLNDLGVGDPNLGSPDVLEPGAESPDGGTFDAAPDTGLPEAPTELPKVEYDTDKLPPPVRRLREQIIEAAKTGDINKLEPIFEANGGPPALSFNATDDAIGQLLSLSGDPEGREILAILIEVLEAGYVHVDIGTPDEMYVWPYFARYPLDALDGPQMVELFKLLTAGDYEDMKVYGAYFFYRVGIAPDGVWRYFLAGD